MLISQLRQFWNAALPLLLFTAGMQATAQQRPTGADSHKKPAAQVEAHAEATPSPAAPLSLLEQPPKPATVKLDAGKLWVQADNASLSQILQSLTADTGMKVDGLNGDQRIFGNYGPGDPHEVLQSLLEGSGYNMMMVGSNNKGAPRQLLLTHRSARGPEPGHAAQAQQETPQEEEDDPNTGEPEEGPTNPPFIQRPGTPDPAENPGGAPPGVPHPGDQADPNVRTPQQMLEQLQQIRQQQMMQQQPDPQAQQDPQQPEATQPDTPQPEP